jgi:hypothetical protein
VVDGRPALDEGLRDLATFGGQPADRLTMLFRRPDDYDENLRGFASLVGMHAGATFEAQASATLAVVREAVEQIRTENAVAGAVLLVALRLHEPTATTARLWDRVDAGVERGIVPDRRRETLRGYWSPWRRNLADRVEKRLTELRATPDEWRLYQRDDEVLDIPLAAHTQPVHIDRLVATYWVRDRRTVRAETERLITAQQEVRSYVVQAWSPEVSEEDPLEVRARLNCTGGPFAPLPSDRGGLTVEREMLFPHTLAPGEKLFFSSEVSGQRNDVPIVEIQVSGQGIRERGLTLRLQFEQDDQPDAVWWFAECLDSERFRRPPDGDGRRLTPSWNGYVEHTFSQAGKPSMKYGVAWAWPGSG